MLPTTSSQLCSEGEHNEKKSKGLATPEGEKLEATEGIASDWYEQQREKRKQVTKQKTKPLKRSRIFTPEQNERLDKLEIMEDDEETTTEE